MKILFKLVAVILILSPLLVYANDNDHEEVSDWKISSVPAGEVINRDYFAYGESVEISGTVNGDVYAVGGQVLVDGTINGDLLAAAGMAWWNWCVPGIVRWNFNHSGHSDTRHSNN